MRRPARLLPGGLREGPHPDGDGGAGRGAAGHDPPGRQGAQRPLGRGNRRGCRSADGSRREDLRGRDRRRRTGGPLRGRVRRLRGAARPRRGLRRHRRTGGVELADPQLPRLRQGRQRQPARGRGVRAGDGLRRHLPVHAPRDGARPLRRLVPPAALRRPVRQRPRGDPRNRRDLPPSRHRVARGARRRGRVLRRPGLGSSCADRQRGLRRRRRELRRPGGTALRPLRKPRDDGRTRQVAGGRHVALSDPGNRGRAERRREDGDHHRRRRGRGPPPAPRAARSRRRRGDHGRRGRPLHPDRSPTARPTGYPPTCGATSTASC